jgi:hypothetical protein
MLYGLIGYKLPIRQLIETLILYTTDFWKCFPMESVHMKIIIYLYILCYLTIQMEYSALSCLNYLKIDLRVSSTCDKLRNVGNLNWEMFSTDN